MDRYCGQCAQCDLNNKQKYGTKYYCKSKREYVELTDKFKAKKCNNYIYDPNKDANYKKKYSPWGLHIITALSEILSSDFDPEVLESLVSTGLKYKKYDDAFKEILFEDYDISGILAAEHLKKEFNVDCSYLIYLYTWYLLSVDNMLHTNRQKEALSHYLKMVQELKTKFNIEGMIDLDYVINVSLPLNNDPLTIFFEAVLGNNILDELITITNYIQQCSNAQIQNKYQEVSTTFFDFYLNLDEYEEFEFYHKYYYWHLRKLYYAINELETTDYKIVNNKLITILDELIDYNRQNDQEFSYQLVRNN